MNNKTSGSLKERMAALGSPLLSVLANLHYLMSTLMKLTLLMGGAAMMSSTRDSPWIRRGLLMIALLVAGFTVYRMLSRKQTRWMFLFRSFSVLFTAGMIIWSNEGEQAAGSPSIGIWRTQERVGRRPSPGAAIVLHLFLGQTAQHLDLLVLLLVGKCCTDHVR
jgi:hypothetical protein